jgi:hypothetical protein
MTNPNSILTKLRRKLSDVIDPMPATGEGWYIGCSLAKGKTIIFPADGVENHIGRHAVNEVLRIAMSRSSHDSD